MSYFNVRSKVNIGQLNNLRTEPKNKKVIKTKKTLKIKTYMLTSSGK